MRRYILSSVLIAFFISCNPTILKKEKTVQTVSALPSLYVLKEKVNLRSRPSIRSGIIASLQDGQELLFKKNIDGWYYVTTDAGKTGWIYSKLAGPMNLSKTRLAAAFVDSVLPDFGAQMFFDKTELYSKVYLSLPESYYSTAQKAKELTRKIGLAYQKQVYQGALEIHVLKPHSKELFLTLRFKAIGMANIPVPEIKTGYLVKMEEKNKQVRLFLAVNDSLNNKILLKSARSISAQYDYPFSKAEIYFLSDSPQGLSFIKNQNRLPANRRVCRLYYIEDKNGEDYHFDFCMEKKAK